MRIGRAVIASIFSLASLSAIAGGVEAAPAMSPAQSFSGFTVGAGVGFSSQLFNHTLYTELNSTGTVDGQNEHGSYGAALQGLLGYYFAFNQNWLAGLVVNGEYDTNPETDHKHFATGNNTDSSFDMDWQTGFDVRIGYAPFERNMFYLAAGPEWGQYRHRFVQNGVTEINVSSFILGGRGALGARQALTDALILGEEVNYTYYSQNSVNFQLTNGTSVLEPQVISAMISLSYRFV